MELAIEELKRAHNYHQRQLEENLQKIQSKQESIELLRKANEKHEEILGEINKALGILKKGICDQTETPEKNIDTGIIPQEGAM